MPSLTYQDDSRKPVLMTAATNLMKAALAHQVPGSIGECVGPASEVHGVEAVDFDVRKLARRAMTIDAVVPMELA